MSDNTELNPQDIYFLAKNSAGVLVIMIMFEITKTLLIPNTDNFLSSLITIFFITFSSIIFFNILINQTKKEKDIIRQEYSEYEKKYLSLTENVPVGIFRTSTDSVGHFLFANPVTIKMLDLSDSDITSVNVRDIYNDSKRRDEIMAKLAKHGYIENEEFEIKTPKGRVFWGRVNAIVRKDENGQNYFEGFINDISDLKTVQQKLKITSDELEKQKSLTLDRDLEISNLKKQIKPTKTHV